MADTTSFDMRQLCGDDTMFGFKIKDKYVLVDPCIFEKLKTMTPIQAFTFGVEKSLEKASPLVIKDGD